MAYRALYRQWRPQTFDEMVGQEHVVRILQNSIRDNRIAHAYLFSGPRGTGKTSAARLYAKALNCEHGPTPEPCDKCHMCEKIRTGLFMDVLEIDAASNRGIEQIRELRERVNFAPAEGRYKVYIIDEVHMLTSEAFNALLKTLEEPPSNVIFILATTEPHRVPATILSRCQRLEFKRISNDDIVQILKAVTEREGIESVEGALRLIADAARGSMRDALGILEQCMTFSSNVLTEKNIYGVIGTVDTTWLLKFTDAIIESNLIEGLKLIGDLESEGRQLLEFTKSFILHFRNLLIIQQLPTSFDEVFYVSENDREKFLEQARKLSYDEIIRCIDILGDVAGRMRWEQNERITLEIALIQIMRAEASSGSNSDLAARLRAVEKKVNDLYGLGLRQPDIGSVFDNTQSAALEQEPQELQEPQKPEEPQEPWKSQKPEEPQKSRGPHGPQALQEPARPSAKARKVKVEEEEEKEKGKGKRKEAVQENGALNESDSAEFYGKNEFINEATDKATELISVTAVTEPVTEAIELISVTPVTPATLPDWWQQIKMRLKAERQDLLCYLEKIHSVSLKDSYLVMEIASEVFMHRLDTPVNRRKLESIASEVLGKSIKVAISAAVQQIPEQASKNDNRDKTNNANNSGVSSNSSNSNNSNDSKSVDLGDCKSLLEYAKGLFGGTIVDQSNKF
jgi:DNA polymerase-3 subunit gamma/tau